MAYPDDPYAPLPVTPWASWEDSPWASYGATGETAPLQPGIGIPSGLLEGSVPPQQEIEMPAMDFSQPEPTIGFPTNPDEQPPMETGDVDTISGADPRTFPPLPEQRSGMQPGLGIPAHLIDQSVIGSAQEGFVPPPPEPESEIEFPPDQLTEQDRRASLDSMDGPDFAEASAEHAEAARVAAAGSLLKAEHEKAKQAEDDYKIYVDARTAARQTRAAVEADAAKLANEKPETWMESRSGFQKVAAFVAAIVGGLVQGRTGSARNSGMDMINEQIQQYSREQAAIRADKRSAINDRRVSAQTAEKDAEDDFRAQAAFEASAWEQTIRMLDADAQNYDQAGTSSFRIAKARRDAVAQQQAALAAFEERKIKRMEAAGKSQLEIAKFIQKSRDDESQRIETARNNKAQNRAAQTSAGAAWKNADTNAKEAEAKIAAAKLENTIRTPEFFAKTYGEKARPPFDMTDKQHKEWTERTGKTADVGKDASEATIKAAAARLEGSGPGSSPYSIGDQEGKPLVNKGGGIFEIKDDKQRQRATDIITAAQNVRRIADIVKIMRADKGGASSTIGSPEYQELQSLASQIDFETFVGYGLGAPSEGDKGLATNVRGGKDIASFVHDPSSGFEAYATGLEEKATAQLRPLGYTGEAIKLKRSEAVQATERTEKENMDTWSPPELLDEAVDPEIRKRAAVRAVESAKTLAIQSSPALIRQYARENKSRLEAGLLDEKQAEKAHKALRAGYGRRLRDAIKARDEDAIASFGVTPALTQRKFVEGLTEEQFYDLLIAEGDN